MRSSTRIAIVGASVMAALALAGCRPITWDLSTDEISSSAQRRVAPLEVHRSPGLDIRMRGCNRVVLSASEADPPVGPVTLTMRPFARVTDSAGTIFFDTASHASVWVQPAGSRIVNTQDDAEADRILVPVEGAVGKLTIESGCTTSPGYGSGGGFTWTFPVCVTSTRSCSTVVGGTPRWVDPLP